MAKITITDLLEAGVHFGHQKRRWTRLGRSGRYPVEKRGTLEKE